MGSKKGRKNCRKMQSLSDARLDWASVYVYTLAQRTRIL